jgi:PAS domain S-box-containing protein
MKNGEVCLHALFATSSDAFFLIDENGHLVGSNATGERWLERESTELEGKLWFSLWPTSIGEMLRSAQWACLLQRHEQVVTTRLVLGGEQRWVEWKLVPLEGGIACMGREQTDLRTRLADSELQLSRIESFIENIPDAFFVQDMEGKILDVNEAACRNLGYTRDELVGMPAYEVETTIKPGSFEGIWNRLEPGIPVTVNGTHRRKNGTTFPVEARLGLFGEGRSALMYVLVRDRSEILRQQDAQTLLNHQLQFVRDEALRANKIKSDFLARMSHELRTPLNASIGYTEIIQEELCDVDLLEAANDAERVLFASRHLLQMIDELLDISKIESQQIELRSESVSVYGLLHEIKDVVQPLFVDNVMEWDIPDAEALGAFYTDSGRLRQVLINLLTNANKFTKKGTVRCAASRKQGADGHERLVFVVADTGLGIAKEHLTAIFDPFIQVDTRSTSKAGVGLGLAICQNICRMMGGEILVESELGKGSTFTVVLPVISEPAKEQKEQARPSSPPPVDELEDGFVPYYSAIDEDAPLLLVIDKDVATHDWMIRQTMFRGLRMKSAFTAREGVAYTRAFLPQFVVVDPVSCGFEGMKLINELMGLSVAETMQFLVYCKNEALVDEVRGLGIHGFVKSDESGALLAQLAELSGEELGLD